MIAINQILDLGYSIKSKSIINEEYDLIHAEKNYLVHFSKYGELTIIHPVNYKGNNERFDDFDDFLKFHMKTN